MATIRCKDGKKKDVGEITRTLAIKLFCTECLGYGEGHPKDCTDKSCPLFSFRGISQLSYSSEGAIVSETPKVSNVDGRKSNRGDGLKRWREAKKASLLVKS